MDISGWIILGEEIGLTGFRVLAWVLGSLGWVKGTEGDGWEPWGTGEGGERRGTMGWDLVWGLGWDLGWVLG